MEALKILCWNWGPSLCLAPFVFTAVTVLSLFHWITARCRRNAPEPAPVACTGPPEVLIIGAGFSGLGLAAQLTQRGIPCLVLEKSPAPGGTWYVCSAV